MNDNIPLIVGWKIRVILGGTLGALLLKRFGWGDEGGILGSGDTGMSG